jgi:hypothetical protein
MHHSPFAISLLPPDRAGRFSIQSAVANAQLTKYFPAFIA